MKLTVERILGNIAVLEREDLAHIEVETSVLPAGVREGSKLIFDGIVYRKDKVEEDTARKRILQKQNKIFKKIQD